jgi:transcriptional regulator with XRE-family HTH domain
MSNLQTRTARLRAALGLTQSAFGARIGQSQSTIDRLEKGRPETPAQAILLNLIERELGEGCIGVPPSAGSVAATAECQSDAA